MNTETIQPGLAPGSFWRVLTPKQQERILIATVREALADEPAPSVPQETTGKNPEQIELI